MHYSYKMCGLNRRSSRIKNMTRSLVVVGRYVDECLRSSIRLLGRIVLDWNDSGKRSCAAATCRTTTMQARLQYLPQIRCVKSLSKINALLYNIPAMRAVHFIIVNCKRINVIPLCCRYIPIQRKRSVYSFIVIIVAVVVVIGYCIYIYIYNSSFAGIPRPEFCHPLMWVRRILRVLLYTRK